MYNILFVFYLKSGNILTKVVDFENMMESSPEGDAMTLKELDALYDEFVGVLERCDKNLSFTFGPNEKLFIPSSDSYDAVEINKVPF